MMRADMIDIDTLILEAEIAAKRARISIDDLCKMIGVNRATWQRWKARRTCPSVTAFNEIEKATAELSRSGPVPASHTEAA